MSSLKELEGTLKDLEGQCVALERAEAEREAAKSAIAKLEAEAAEAESTIEKLKARIIRETQIKEELAAKASAQTVTAVSGPEADERRARAAAALEEVRKRNKRLHALQEKCNDPEAVKKEEGAIKAVNDEIVKLMKDRVLYSRELKQRSKQVESATEKLESQEATQQEAARKFEEYIERLKEVEKGGQAAAASRRKVADALKEEWQGWFDMLCETAKTLKARGEDGGGDAAATGSSQTNPKETPVASVLEAVHRAETRRRHLKAKVAVEDGKAKSLKAKLARIDAKLEQYAARHAAVPRLPPVAGAATLEQPQAT